MDEDFYLIRVNGEPFIIIIMDGWYISVAHSSHQYPKLVALSKGIYWVIFYIRLTSVGLTGTNGEKNSIRHSDLWTISCNLLMGNCTYIFGILRLLIRA